MKENICKVKRWGRVAGAAFVEVLVHTITFQHCKPPTQHQLTEKRIMIKLTFRNIIK